MTTETVASTPKEALARGLAWLDVKIKTKGKLGNFNAKGTFTEEQACRLISFIVDLEREQQPK